MPHGSIHKKKFWKNVAVLGAIAGFSALIWIITMIKIAGPH